jgi:hypothetical protein
VTRHMHCVLNLMSAHCLCMSITAKSDAAQSSEWQVPADVHADIQETFAVRRKSQWMALFTCCLQAWTSSFAAAADL